MLHGGGSRAQKKNTEFQQYRMQALVSVGHREGRGKPTQVDARLRRLPCFLYR